MNRSRPGMPPPAPWWAVARGRGVPWWGAVCSAAAPVLLGVGSTIGGHLQPRSYNAMTGTVSALAALGAADRWVMTLAFAAAGACEIATGLALRPAAVAGRLILVTGGVAGLLVAASPEPAGAGGSMRHALSAALGLAAMAAWPAAARRRGPSVPWGLRPRVSAAVSVFLLGVLLWFGAELIAGGGLDGLAERVLGGTLTLWPPLVVLSCRCGRPPAAAARRADPRIQPPRQVGSGHQAASTGHDGRNVAQPR
jgi:uncharacterized protein DUF998